MVDRSFRALVVACLFCFAAGAGFAFLFFHSSLFGAKKSRAALSNSTAPADVVLSPVTDAPPVKGAGKPWGEIEAIPFPFADFDHIFADRPLRLQPAKWFFEGAKPREVLDLFQSCHLPPPQLAGLTNPAMWSIFTNGILITPPSSVVRDLSRTARAEIYKTLAASPQNYSQQFPFRFRLNQFDTLFEGAELQPSNRELLRTLVYTNAGTLCFTDLQLLPDLLNEKELREVIEAVYSWPVYRLRLHLRPDSRLDELIKYWGTGGREKRLKPLMESIAKAGTAGDNSINVAYFFPPFARLRLYTFPESWGEDRHPNREDCFWTSLNFFNDDPDDRYFDTSVLRETIQTQYSQVKGEPRFGDLLMVTDSDGNGLHVCVYVADDFVFTKNGMNMLQPWVIMKLEDMMLGFASEKPRPLVLFRKKEIPTATGTASTKESSNSAEALVKTGASN